MPTQKMRVTPMTAADEPVVTAAVREMEGVIYAVANHADACVEVEFEDDCVTIEEIAQRLERLGFSAAAAG